MPLRTRLRHCGQRLTGIALAPAAAAIILVRVLYHDLRGRPAPCSRCGRPRARQMPPDLAAFQLCLPCWDAAGQSALKNRN